FPRPQTREHFIALQTLGINNIVVVQNKVDLVSREDAIENYKQIKEFLEEHGLDDAPIIPISAQQRANIDALIEAIEEYIPTPERDPNKDPIMHVLRSFDINKPGTKPKDLKGGVIGGSLTQGEFRVGDKIEIKPGIYNEKSNSYEVISTDIVSLATGAGLVDFVKPGGLSAIGTKLDPAFTKSDSLIGNVIGKPGKLPDNVTSISMEVSLFDTAVGTAEPVKVEPIRDGEPLRLNIGTAVVLGIVNSVRDSRVDIKLRRPVCLLKNSRIAISRRIADRWRLIGAGIAKN
ncbi:MAG: translation initiation factor IF-2 subunit gamma, partial [Candidatus Nitrosothermus koennekii]